MADPVERLREYAGDGTLLGDDVAEVLDELDDLRRRVADPPARQTEAAVVGRHCDLLDQAWRLMRDGWDAQTDDRWRAAVKKWRDAFYALWGEHCGHDPGPAPYGFPSIARAKEEKDGRYD